MIPGSVMSRGRTAAAMLSCLLVLGCARGRTHAPTPASVPQYELSGSPTDTILVYDRLSSWFRRAPQKHLLVITGDGFAQVEDPTFDDYPTIRGRMDSHVLLDLLTFVLDEQDFRHFSAAAVDSAKAAIIRRTGRGRGISDAGVVQLEVRMGGSRFAGSYEAPDWYAQKYPGIDALRRFVIIGRRLRSLAYEIRLGGRHQVLKYLARANAALLAKDATAQRLSPESLWEVYGKGGSVSVSFRGPISSDSTRYAIVRLTYQGNRPRKADVVLIPAREYEEF